MLSLISVLAVYSSTKMISYYGVEDLGDANTERFVFKHMAIMLFGFVIIFIAHRINYRFYSGFSKLLMPIGILLVVLTYFLAEDHNEARRFLPLPILSLTLQTSDVAKLGLIMFMARTIAKKQETITDFQKGFLPLMLPILLVCLSIAPSDFSTAAGLMLTSLTLLFIGRANIKHIGLVLLVASVTLLIMIGLAQAFDWEWLRWATWESRLADFLGGGEGSFQNQQAKIAIARGGLFGVGPGNSMQRNFLPNPYADFIFAIIVEEYGFLGALILVFLYLLLLHRSIRILLKAPNSFGALLAVGLSLLMVIQAMLNMGVAVHILPNTGLPMPLVSMGGTSMVFTSFAIGVVLSVSAFSEENEGNKPSKATKDA